MAKSRSHRKTDPRNYVRALRAECLEPRRLLAADVFAFQNPAHALDVTHDSFVTPADALTIVNTLNGFDLFNGKVGAYLDTNGDRTVAPNDVMGIINFLNGATDSELDAVDTEFEFASEYCEDHFDNIPEGLKPVAQQFIDATNEFVSSKVLRDTALSNFLEFSLDNNAAIVARYQEIEVATGVIDKEYRLDLQELGVGLTELVSANFPTDPTTVDEYPEEYDFDPDEFDNIEDVFDELFNEIDDVVGEIEVPDYGDVIDNFDDVFQTYDDTEFGLDEFVGGFLETDEYDIFVLENLAIEGFILANLIGGLLASTELPARRRERRQRQKPVKGSWKPKSWDISAATREVDVGDFHDPLADGENVISDSIQRQRESYEREMERSPLPEPEPEHEPVFAAQPKEQPNDLGEGDLRGMKGELKSDERIKTVSDIYDLMEGPED